MVEMNGQEIYDNFHTGVGAEGLASGAAMVKTVAGRYRDRAVEIHQLVGEMEAAWEGDSADRARRGAGPLLSEHESASHHFSVSEDLNDRQSGSFFRARNSVVPVPAVPTDVPPWGPLSPGWTSFEQRVHEYSDAARHNVDVMSSYSGASTYNADNLPTRYGELADDQAGAVVDNADTIHVDDPRDSSRGAGPGHSQPLDTGRVAGPGSGDTDLDGTAPGQLVPNDTTTPGGFSPVPGQSLPSTDQGQARPTPVGSPVAGVFGTGYPPGRGGPGEFGGPRAGGPAGGPRTGGPSGGLLPRGPGVGAEPHGGNAARGGSTFGTGAGRSVGLGMSGVPLGTGRGRGEEDDERKTPAYLEGGDPEDLFGNELLTSPAVIGEDDEED